MDLGLQDKEVDYQLKLLLTFDWFIGFCRLSSEFCRLSSEVDQTREATASGYLLDGLF